MEDVFNDFYVYLKKEVINMNILKQFFFYLSFRRVKRSESPKYFTPNDIHILGFSPGAQNSWKIEFAVLFPSVDGQAPQITEPNELVEMVSESKESIGNAVGATIQRITVVQPATKKPTDGKNIKGIF